MRAVDNALLALLAATSIDVNDSIVDADNSGSDVDYPLPYLVFHSSIGDDHNPRLTGRYGRRSVFFTVMYVGLSRDQAKWAGEKARLALVGKRVAGAGIGQSWLIGLEESQRVRRDDDAIRPDGTPLFYGVDNYSVSVTLNAAGVSA